jgi:DNA modification methylase
MELKKVYNENCQATMARMQDASVDMIITSPPYDNLRKYKGYEFDFEGIAKECYRILKPGGVMVWVVADATVDGCESLTSMRQAIYFVDECGFNMHDTMIYAKVNYIQLTHNRYEQEWEYMFVLSKGRPKTFNPLKEPTKGKGKKYNLKREGYCSTVKEGAQRRRDEVVVTAADKIRGNIFYYTLGGERVGHPAPFPSMLVGDQVLTWTNEGDVVYDPMVGSGTTARVCHKLKREWIASEISEEYAAMAQASVDEMEQQQQLF